MLEIADDNTDCRVRLRNNDLDLQRIESGEVQRSQQRSPTRVFLKAQTQTAEKRQFNVTSVNVIRVNDVMTKPFNSLDLAEQICKILNG